MNRAKRINRAYEINRWRKFLIGGLAFVFALTLFSANAMASAWEQEQAANRLIILGVIEGYPDGSLGLDTCITRAEMAKVCMLAGGEAVARDYRPVVLAPFEDVKGGMWYAGWVNAAAEKNLIKGDGKGNFRPGDPVTYDESVTLFLRLLGFDDNLGGKWPADFLDKGKELKITEGLNQAFFNSNRSATRGDVFVMLHRALDQQLVSWDKKKQTYLPGDAEEKLVDLTNKTKFKDMTRYGLLTGVEGSLYKSSVLMLDVLTQEGEQKTYRLNNKRDWLIFGENGGYFTAYKDKEWFIPIQYEIDGFERIKTGTLKIALPASDFTDYNGFNFKAKDAVRLGNLYVDNLSYVAFDALDSMLIGESKEYLITNKTVLMKAEVDKNGNHGGAALLRWDNVKSKNPGKVNAYVVSDATGKAQFVFFYDNYGELAGGLLYGIVVSRPFQSKGDWVADINTVHYGVKDYILPAKDAVRAGDIVKFYSYGGDEEGTRATADIVETYAEKGGTHTFKNIYVQVVEDGKVGDLLEVRPAAAGGSTMWYEFNFASLIFNYNHGYRTSLEKSDIKAKDRLVVVDDEGVVKIMLRVNNLFRDVDDNRYDR